MTQPMNPKKLAELAERAVIALERIAGAMAGEVVPDVPDEILAADLRNGMSLRKCASKHGVGVGRVRGASLRSLSGKRSSTDGEGAR